MGFLADLRKTLVILIFFAWVSAVASQELSQPHIPLLPTPHNHQQTHSPYITDSISFRAKCHHFIPLIEILSGSPHSCGAVMNPPHMPNMALQLPSCCSLSDLQYVASAHTPFILVVLVYNP